VQYPSEKTASSGGSAAQNFAGAAAPRRLQQDARPSAVSAHVLVGGNAAVLRAR